MDVRVSRASSLCSQWLKNHVAKASDDDLVLESVKRRLPQSDRFSKIQRRARKKNLSDLILAHDCEWSCCCFSTEDYGKFQRHVAAHAPEEPHSEMHECSWDMCGFETDDGDEIVRHLNYHAYHTRLKAIGNDVHDRYGLEKCERDVRQKNQLPETSSAYSCRWTGCSLKFNSIQQFIDHVYCHVQSVDPEEDGMLSCDWLGCELRVLTLNKMKMHVRRHTGERIVACPQCGTCFASNAVYEDHCARQAVPISDFKCHACGKAFATERLLRIHERRHVNSFKCIYCDLTLSAPSALSKHIRHKHLNFRAFECPHCPYRAVENSDLQNHIRRHEGILPVDKRSGEKRTYICHCCNKCFKAGRYLTKHLVKVHGYIRNSSFPRFRYKLDDDGFYRLIPERYESLDVSNQIMAEKDNDSPIVTTVESKDFKLLLCTEGDSERMASYTVIPSTFKDKDALEKFTKENRASIKNNKGNGARKRDRSCTSVSPRRRKKKIKHSTTKKNTQTPVKAKTIEISISEVDYDGNVIRSEVMESCGISL